MGWASQALVLLGNSTLFGANLFLGAFVRPTDHSTNGEAHFGGDPHL